MNLLKSISFASAALLAACSTVSSPLIRPTKPEQQNLPIVREPGAKLCMEECISLKVGEKHKFGKLELAPLSMSESTVLLKASIEMPPDYFLRFGNTSVLTGRISERVNGGTGKGEGVVEVGKLIGGRKNFKVGDSLSNSSAVKVNFASVELIELDFGKLNFIHWSGISNSEKFGFSQAENSVVSFYSEKMAEGLNGLQMELGHFKGNAFEFANVFQIEQSGLMGKDSKFQNEALELNVSAFISGKRFNVEEDSRNKLQMEITVPLNVGGEVGMRFIGTQHSLQSITLQEVNP